MISNLWWQHRRQMKTLAYTIQKNAKNVTSTVGGAADCRRALSENRTEGTVGDGNVVTASFTALTNDDTSPKL